MMTDEQLMRSVAEGNSLAFRQLLARHLPRAHAIARRVLRSEQDVEEAVQDAFGKVWVNAASFDAERAAFTTWFYRIITNTCLDRVRREKPAHADLDALAEKIADETPSAETEVIEAEEGDKIRRAVQTLPDRQRMAVVLSYFDGLTNPEAAEAMGVHVKALEGLLVRARRALREKLEGPAQPGKARREAAGGWG